MDLVVCTRLAEIDHTRTGGKSPPTMTLGYLNQLRATWQFIPTQVYCLNRGFVRACFLVNKAPCRLCVAPVPAKGSNLISNLVAPFRPFSSPVRGGESNSLVDGQACSQTDG